MQLIERERKKPHWLTTGQRPPLNHPHRPLLAHYSTTGRKAHLWITSAYVIYLMAKREAINHLYMIDDVDIGVYLTLMRYLLSNVIGASLEI
jgi:hypothetical protein